SNVNVVLTGTSSSGSGFYDPGPDFPNRISATVNGGGVTVNSITFTNPTSITLNITIAANATPGARTVTVTNPDAQSAISAAGIFTINVNANTPPSFTSVGTITRQQGSAGTVSTIATVTDSETAAGNLTVTALPPAGITLTGITNTNGTITATVAASCTAILANNIVPLTVTDGGGLTATGSLNVNVTANTPPTLGTYPSTTVSAGGSTTATPSVAPTDNG